MRLFELNELQPFKTDEYNTPNQMEMMANPDYWRERKGTVGSVQWMSPTQYISSCETGFKRSGIEGLVRDGRNPELIRKYAYDMKKGDKFPMLELDYRDGDFGQEGLHRAMAAETLGVKKLPVFIMKDTPEKEEARRSKNDAEYRKVKQKYTPSQKDYDVVDDILGAFDENLTEGISPVVYHFMGVHSAESVLKQNKFRLTASAGTGAERALEKGDRMYYLSTTRHKLGGYHIDNSWSGVIFELDGDKLSQNYAGKPVDYWGPEWYQNKEGGGKGPEKKEAEDRVYSYKPYITDASKYIRGVHVLFDENAQKRHADRAIEIRRMFISAKRRGVPAYLYVDKQDWLVQDKRKRVNPASLDVVAKASGKKKDTGRSYNSITRRTLSPWIELYKAPVGSKVSKEADKTRYNYVLYGYSDSAQSLAADLHNAKSKPADETGLDTLLQIFRKEKIRNPQQYLDLLKDKWAPKEESLEEEAPPGMEDWIKKRKPEFKKRYGDDWESVLYATAWKRHNAS